MVSQTDKTYIHLTDDATEAQRVNCLPKVT